MSKSYFKILYKILKVINKRFCTIYYVSKINRKNFNMIIRRLCLLLSKGNLILSTFF